MAVGKRAEEMSPRAVRLWEESGYAKIVLKVPNLEEMEEIARRAGEMGIPTALIADAGRTQIAPGSKTVLGLGPAPESMFEDLTGHLKLL